MLYPKPLLNRIEKENPRIIDKIFAELQKLTDETLQSEGRTYGGGLIKLEPRELSRIRLETIEIEKPKIEL